MREFEFIRKLEDIFNNRDNLIGDDAALINNNILISKDILVENVHFLKSTPLEHVIHKLFTANISDIASMGGTSKYVFLGIAAEHKEILEIIIPLVKKECEQYNVTLAGGDTTSSKSGLFLSLTVIGEKGKNILMRSGACENDIIFLSRPVGKCKISLEKELNIKNHNIDKYEHYKVCAEDRLGSFLSSLDFITSATDISDGLSTDLYNIAESSHKKAVIEYNKLPVDYLKEYNVNSLDYILSSGEEYALLFTAKKDSSKFLKKLVKDTLNQEIIPIGRMEKGSGIFLEKDGHMQSIILSGYEHFE